MCPIARLSPNQSIYCRSSIRDEWKNHRCSVLLPHRRAHFTSRESAMESEAPASMVCSLLFISRNVPRRCVARFSQCHGRRQCTILGHYRVACIWVHRDARLCWRCIQYCAANAPQEVRHTPHLNTGNKVTFSILYGNWNCLRPKKLLHFTVLCSAHFLVLQGVQWHRAADIAFQYDF